MSARSPAENCLAPLDAPGGKRSGGAAASVGRSYPSYHWQGHQWAFPIDAATRCRRGGRTACRSPATWAEMLDLARQGCALLPLRPPHSLMVFYTLAGNLGRPATEGPATT